MASEGENVCFIRQVFCACFVQNKHRYCAKLQSRGWRIEKRSTISMLEICLIKACNIPEMHSDMRLRMIYGLDVHDICMNDILVVYKKNIPCLHVSVCL